MAEALSPAISDSIDALAHAVLKAADEQDLKLVTAESCTGGLVASLLTDIPGRSHAFDRGFVVYSNEAKHDLLGVDRALLASPGPVSQPVARAMAEGALGRSVGDLALSVTGMAESSPDSEAPGGLVHFALARTGARTVHRVERFGEIGRAQVRLRCLETGLEMLRASLDQTT